MKSTRKNLNDMLSLVREHPQTTALVSSDDVRNLLGQRQRQLPRHHSESNRNIIMGILAATILGTAFYLSLNTSPSITSVHHRTIGPNNVAPAGAYQQSGPSRQPTSGIDPGKPAGTDVPAPPTRTTPVNGAPVRSSSHRLSKGTGTPAAKPNKELLPGILVIKIRQDSASTKHGYDPLTKLDSTLNIPGVRRIELAAEELARLNIRMSDGKIQFITEQRIIADDSIRKMNLRDLGYNLNGEAQLVRFTTMIDSFSMEFEALPNPSIEGHSKIAPISFSNQWVKDESLEGSFFCYVNNSPLLDSSVGSREDLKNEIYDLYMVDDDAAPITHQYRTISRLIPIYIRMGSGVIEGTNRRRGGDIFLWFFPTREFVAALPDRYRIPLQKELDVIADVEERCLPSRKVCERLTGEQTFFDYCRKSSGAIKSTAIYPNPAHREVTIKYFINQIRQVSVSLHDLSGRYLRELSGYQQQSAGEHETALDLGDIQPGAYLIAIKTDAAEQAVQRVIVQ